LLLRLLLLLLLLVLILLAWPPAVLVMIRAVGTVTLLV